MKAVERHLEALEGLPRQTLDKALDVFDQQHFADSYLASTDRTERRDVLRRIQAAVDAADDVNVFEKNDKVILALDVDGNALEVRVGMAGQAPFGMTSLEILDVTDQQVRIELTADNLTETFEKLADDGFSGVVHVRKNGEVLLENAYGIANEELGYPVRLDSVFGIGSTPIDFTVAGIYLLEQQGRIDRNETIDTYFDNVPDDKRNMTIGHLMEGRSGLPDFFDTDDDWDADLAWVDRNTAEHWLLNQELLFEPGTDESHSHGAFGLLSILIERVSGQDYYSFMKENFFNPADMKRTAMYGDRMGLTLADFAEGRGPQFVGLPNIPPNWGPTSWLILGSGGMASCLGDMVKFYAFMRSGKLLKAPYDKHFMGIGASINGSLRGAYLSHNYKGADNEAILISNINGASSEVIMALTLALEQLVEDSE